MTSIADLADLVDQHRRRTRAPAAAAALVPAVGEPVVAVAGERVRGGGVPATGTDRWHIGSCMKAMTAATVARFVQEGRVDWSTPITELFGDAGPVHGSTMHGSPGHGSPGHGSPGHGSPGHGSPGHGGPVHSGWQGRTLADVLTHTAGMPANPTADEMRAALTDAAPLPAQRDRLARQTLRRAPTRPGRFCYSNLGYVVVGAALERLADQPFEEILRARLLEPLGISSSGFGAPMPDQPWGHRARRLGIGRGPAIDPTSRSLRHPPDNPPLLSPAGRLHLTMSDWAAFVRLFLDQDSHSQDSHGQSGLSQDSHSQSGLGQGGELLTAESLVRLTTPPPGGASPQGMGWWVPPGGSLRRRIAYAQQGSNARWVATAVVAADRSKAALVACNDGRTRMLASTFQLAVDLLEKGG